MARIDVVMPQMGESIAEGTLSRWLKKVGDEVKRDEPIFEISTDKVDAEIPASSAGVLAEILVSEGETVPVQTVVARLETEKGALVEAGAGAPTAAPAAQTAPTGEAGGAPPPPAAAQASAAPAAAAPAGDGANGKSFESRVRTRSSPLVRKIAADHGIDISAMRGSGVAGRVTKRDILQAIESGTAVAAGGAVSPGWVPAGAPPRAGAGMAIQEPPQLPPPEPLAGDVVEPMSVMRQRISEHMILSRRTSAHVTSFMEVDFTRVARIRAAHRADFLEKSGQKLTYMPFIIKSVVDGLRAFPVVNSSVDGNKVIYHKQYNIGIAVALDWGLIVPVLRNAEDFSLTGITRALNDLAARARAKRLNPDEVQGGTFTITNPGVFGSLMGTPIINQPQVAILGVGAIEKRPKVLTGADGEDTIAIRTCAYFSISFDHRIIDGAVADQFLAHVKNSLETFPDAGI